MTLIAAVFIGILFEFTGRFLATTMWAGRAITSPDNRLLMPVGAQVSITPPWLANLAVGANLGLVGLFVGGSLQRWWFGVAALTIALAVSLAARTVMPSGAAAYLRIIVHSLANRAANYQRSGDTLRAEAARYLFTPVTVLLGRAIESKQPVPTMREAKATPFGQVTGVQYRVPDADAVTRASLDKAFPAADAIVTRYATLLESSTNSPFHRESSLPGGREAVKSALVIAAVVRRANNQISEAELQYYRNAYTRLLYFLPDDRFDAIDRALTSMKGAGGPDNLSAAQVRDSARSVGSAYQPHDLAQDEEQQALLPVEFDSQLASSLKLYQAKSQETTA